jgi:hypothetical protein
MRELRGMSSENPSQYLPCQKNCDMSSKNPAHRLF